MVRRSGGIVNDRPPNFGSGAQVRCLDKVSAFPTVVVNVRNRPSRGRLLAGCPVGLLGHVGTSSRLEPRPLGLIAKGKSRDPREARQPDSPTLESNAGPIGTFRRLRR